MTTAICFKCGEVKADPLSHCPQCGAVPRIELVPLEPRTTGGMLVLAAGVAAVALALALIAAHWS
jgi:hypothetical protein